MVLKIRRQVRLAFLVELTEDVVEQDDRLEVRDLLDDPDFEEFERQYDRPHLAARRGTDSRRTVEFEQYVVAVRPDARIAKQPVAVDSRFQFGEQFLLSVINQGM